ncbi:MAG: UDP-2,3-diacylglucosamine diphosphatase LpxI domain-containing protein [Planctomycetota bacterium]|jgi:DUF1009 family protein
MGSVQPSREQRGDIGFGWPLLRQIVELGIGTAMVVRERDVIAVEATEGTVSLIERAGALCRTKGWVLLKTTGPGRDCGTEAPAIDVETVEALARAGGGCLALGAGRVRLTDEARTLEAAAKAKVAVVGVGENP